MRWGKLGWRNHAPRPSAQRAARVEYLPGGAWLGASWRVDDCHRNTVGFVGENAEYPEYDWRELHVYVCLVPMLPVHVVWGLRRA